jgi:hypothetical protein
MACLKCGYCFNLLLPYEHTNQRFNKTMQMFGVPHATGLDIL